jgi:hypothetical protein
MTPEDKEVMYSTCDNAMHQYVEWMKNPDDPERIKYMKQSLRNLIWHFKEEGEKTRHLWKSHRNDNNDITFT